MKRDDVLQRLKAAETRLRAQGVAHAALFGSLARGDERPESDIDIMVEITPEAEAQMGVYEYVGIVNTIEDLFPVKVDVSNRESMKSHLRPCADRDAIYAF